MTLFGSWPGFLTGRHFMSTQLCTGQRPFWLPLRPSSSLPSAVVDQRHLDFTNEYDELWTLMDSAGLWWIMMDYEMYKPIQRCDLHKVLKCFECAKTASTYPWTFPSSPLKKQWTGSVENLQTKPPSSSQPSVFAVPKSSFSAPVVPQCRWRN